MSLVVSPSAFNAEDTCWIVGNSSTTLNPPICSFAVVCVLGVTVVVPLLKGSGCETLRFDAIEIVSEPCEMARWKCGRSAWR